MSGLSAWIQVVLLILLLMSSVYISLSLCNLKCTLNILLATGILVVGIICFLVETLSVFKLLTRSGLLLGHSLILLILVFIWIRRGLPRLCLSCHWRSFWKNHFDHESSLQILALVGLVILTASLFLALYSPPNNADSMTYHMARVGYWHQHASLEHYDANVERQNNLSPGAEILILWTVLLSTSDRLANMIQYLAFVMALLAVYGLARRLGFSKQQSMFAMLIAVTVPTFILESTSTQNDLVSGAFLVASLYFLITWLEHNQRACLVLACWAGALSALVKSSSWIYLFAFVLVILAWRASWRQRIAAVLLWGVGLMVGGVITSGPYLARNLGTYGWPTGPTYSLLNQELSAQALVGNIYRNVALHIEFPAIASRLTQIADDWSRRVSYALGIDLNHPATTLPGTRFRFKIFKPHEDYAGIGLPIFSLWLIAGGIFLKSLWNEPRNVQGLAYWTLVLVVMLSFAMVFRWQPWHTRLHVPLILLACPLLAQIHHSTPMNSIRHLCVSYVVLGAMVLGLVSAMFNHMRPLLPFASKHAIWQMPRENILYVGHPCEQDIYKAVFHSKPDARYIGIHAGPSTYEYPFFGRQFGRKLFPLPRPTIYDSGALSEAFSTHHLDLVISEIFPRDSTDKFNVRPLTHSCPRRYNWLDTWSRSTVPTTTDVQEVIARGLTGKAEHMMVATPMRDTSEEPSRHSWFLITQK